MATKTLIIRPTGFVAITNSPAKGFPSDTVAEDYYKLVNEEIADDDATYISVSGINAATLSGLLFEIPDEHTHCDFLSCTIKARAKANAEGLNFNISYDYSETPSDTSTITNTSITIGTLSTSYQDYAYVLEEQFLTYFTSNKSVYVRHQHGTISKDNSCILTQIYLELTYETSDEDGEDDTSESIYIKQNGSWVAITGTIYHKENGVWVVTDSSALQNGTQYIVIKEAE